MARTGRPKKTETDTRTVITTVKDIEKLSSFGKKFTGEQIEAIVALFDVMSDEEIAKKYDVDISRIIKIRNQRELLEKSSTIQSVVDQLHAEHFWAIVKKQLFTTEIDFFEKEWALLIEQFSSSDILHTDKIQIKDLILAEIFLDRNLCRKRDTMKDLDDAKRSLELEEKKDTPDPVQLQMLRGAITQFYQQLDILSKEQGKYEERKDKLFEGLKATRNQRMKQIEERGKDIFGLIKWLDTKEARETEGRVLSLIKEAKTRVYNDLTTPVEFDDGQEDIPLLVPEIFNGNDIDQETGRSETDVRGSGDQ